MALCVSSDFTVSNVMSVTELELSSRGLRNLIVATARKLPANTNKINTIIRTILII